MNQNQAFAELPDHVKTLIACTRLTRKAFDRLDDKQTARDARAAIRANYKAIRVLLCRFPSSDVEKAREDALAQTGLDFLELDKKGDKIEHGLIACLTAEKILGMA